MTVSELKPILQVLPRAEKFHLIQFLLFELAKEDDILLSSLNQSYPVWTPYHAFDAGNTLLEVLETTEVAPHG
ncbi:MAG: hypothetical protein B6242_02440 [Anaerolineaceae bacterium 4572_78]|nr:MAG: hypothetical protein B6242_02440 [Anaerolineaceae bacterium 4572_78]